MKDSFGREISYLRISLTDRCNLSCGYCMPSCGIKHISESDILTIEETARIISVMASLGVCKIRFTGGEPLLRKELMDFVHIARDTDGINEVCLTTNGVLLPQYAEELRNAGLDKINISLDTLNSETFYRITGKNSLDNVLKGIGFAIDTGFQVKLNCIPMREINNTELDRIASISKELPVDVRFIELMPIGCGKKYTGITSDEVLSILEKRLGKAELLKKTENTSAALYYQFSGFSGKTGFISPLSHKFCKDCNRARLTANGFLKLCLQYPVGTDLRTPLRKGCTDDDLAYILTEAIKNKPAEHSFSEIEITDMRKMVQIGG